MSTEKDRKYIEAFRCNDQRLIREAYFKLKPRFINYISSKNIIPEEYLEDAYQETVIRLQQNILYGRLTEDNLTSSLSTYITEGIGEKVANELLRSFKEQPYSRLPRNENYKRDSEDDYHEDSNGEVTHTYLPFSDLPEEDRTEEIIRSKKEDIILEEVMWMGKPCAPLLIGYYWKNNSMQQLAEDLCYSSADVAKNQKARCMNKLRTHITNLFKQLGYA